MPDPFLTGLEYTLYSSFVVLTRNHTIIGDPLFTVPYQSRVAGRRRNLCFEIHGRRNTHFNLITDTCISVNALYSGVNTRNGYEINIISSIGIRTQDSDGNCRDIKVDIEGCSVSTGIDGELTSLDTNTFTMARISIRKRSPDRVRVSVPNCEDVNLMMWVICERANPVDMIRFQVARGINLRPTSHGLLGNLLQHLNYMRSTVLNPSKYSL